MKWALTCLPFPQELGIKSTAVYRNSNEMAEHRWCLGPEPPCVIPVMTIYLRLYLFVLFASRTVTGPFLNIDTVLIGVGFRYNLTVRSINISESFWIFWQIARNLHILEKFVCKWHLPEKKHSTCSVTLGLYL